MLSGSCRCGAVRIEIPPHAPAEVTACSATPKVGVNMRNFEPIIIAQARIRMLDGADTWNYIDEEKGTEADAPTGSAATRW